MNIPIDKGLEETVMNNIHKVTTNADKTVDNARYFISLLQKKRERANREDIYSLSQGREPSQQKLGQKKDSFLL